jgi:hypothetical protein
LDQGHGCDAARSDGAAALGAVAATSADHGTALGDRAVAPGDRCAALGAVAATSADFGTPLDERAADRVGAHAAPR